MTKKIIHIDMDAFFAAVEQRDNPELRGKPVVVGGSPEGRGGVVATASYEARIFGIRSAMPSKKARELCPDAIFVPPRFDAYKEVSRHVRTIFERYTDQIEPLSLDEAYLDVTVDKKQIGSAITIAEEIRSAIRDELRLTASAGISVNKFVAKIASDMHKPDGMTFIGPSKIEKFMEDLAVEKFFGVGKVTAQRMQKIGIFKGSDLKKFAESELVKLFGKSGSFFYRIVRGIDDREVQPHRETKSVGAEDTFQEDLTDYKLLCDQIAKLSLAVHKRLLRHELKGKTLTLKVKYSDFKIITRSRSLDDATDDAERIGATASQLLATLLPLPKGIRLLGITVSKFALKANDAPEANGGQLFLFDAAT